MLALVIFVLSFISGLSRVAFLGYPNGGNISVTCQTAVTFPVGNYFAQTCIANNCIAPVTFSWSPDLSQYGLVLNTISPATIVVNPTPTAIAMGSLSTTVTANDNDGPSATGPVTFTFACPLSLATPVPDQTIQEGQFWSIDASTYFNNPARHIITYRVEGFAAASSITINSQGVLGGIAGAVDATASQPLLATIVATDTTTGMSVRSNQFKIFVTPLPGISFPSGFGLITAQVATEGVLWSFNAARYFLNPSNFRVTWSLNAGSLSGLTIDQSTGIVSITPGAAELLATSRQPAAITVTGVDERGNTATSNSFQFSVVPAKLVVLPTAGSLPDLPCGSFCCAFNPADYVRNPSSNPATYTLVSGIPAGSTIRLSPNGTLSGIASSIDVRASPITIQASVNNGDTAGPTPLGPFTFNVVGLATPTVSSQVVPVTTIKVGTFFQLDVKPYFALPAGSVANWTIAGTSSLSIDFNGVVSGTLQDSDYLNSPTLSFVVTVSNRGTCGGGSASRTFTFSLTANWQGPTCAGIQSTISVCEGMTFPYRNFATLCRDPKNSTLTYSITGLPNNTGLVFDSTSGTLRGVVSLTASSNPAASVSICAMNEHALQDCSAPFQILFQHAKHPPVADPPIPSPVTAIKGQRFVGYFNFHFYEEDGQPLIYSVAGLPIGSGLGIGPITGIFSGTPNEADFRASPLVLSVFASNEQNVNPQNTVCASQGQGGRARADLIIIIESPPAMPICRPIPQDGTVAQVGMFWARDVSQSFQPGDGATKLEFALRSLPRGSGLSVDPRSGVVSGVLTQQDLTSSPETIVVAATNGYGGCQSSFQLNIVSRIRPQPSSSTVPAFPPISPPAVIVQPVIVQPVIVPSNNNNNIPPPQSVVINPCLRNNGGCQQICVNQNGSPVCSCPPNWFLNSDRQTCGYDACGANNGGCEQLCTASGQQAKCDCRVGTLNSDRRTCGSSIIVVGTIPPGLVLGCQYFMFDFSTAVSNAGGKPLTFRMSGLSPQTGFGISSGGLISGTPTAADCASAQPMAITVTATDGTASVQAVMFLSAFCDSSCGGNGQVASGGGSGQPNLPAAPSPAASSSASSIPLMWAWVCRDFNFDLSRYFSGGMGSVSFSCLGLPSGTGFDMSPAGTLRGVPNSVDCARSPLMLTVVARDAAGRESKAIVTVKFSSCGCVQQSSSKGSLIAPASLLPSYPSIPTFPISQPIISSPVITSTIISPIPSRLPATTLYQAAPIVSATVLPYSVGQSASPTQLHTHAVAQCGQPFFLDTSEYFRVNNLQYTLSGLPPGTGLRLSDSGVLSGTPNSIDSRTVNPLVATIVGTDRTGACVTLLCDIEIKGDCGSLPPSQNQFVTNYRSGFALAPADANTGLLPVQTAVAGQLFRLDLSRVAFSGFRGKMRYELYGLPVGSGLTMTSSGLLSGIPSAGVCQANPVGVNVIAVQEGKRANGTFFVQFSCQAQTNVLTAGGSQLPTVTGTIGELLYYDCAPYMTTVNSNVTFEVAGLDAKSGLRMSPTGVLSGIPSIVDLKGPPLLVTAKDKARHVIQSTLLLNIVAQASGNRPPTFIPLEPVHASSGQYFSVNVRQRFYDEDSDNLTLSIVDLPSQSGIKFDNQTGVLSGTPSAFDVAQTQPILFKTFADDAHGGKTEGSIYVFFVSSNSQKEGKSQTSQQNLTAILNNATATTRVNRDPVSLSIKRQVAVEGIPFLFGVASSFVDQDGDVLTYSVDGLPRDTGLSIDRASGVIAGTPTQADSDALQPISVTISVTDGQGGSCAQIFLLTVFQGEESSNHAPDARAIPDGLATMGKLFFLRLSFSFADADGDALNYTIEGLPAGTGFRLLASSGIFTGTASAKDQAASPMSLVVHVDDGRGGVATSLFSLKVVTAPAKSTTTIISTVSSLDKTQQREVLKKVSTGGVVGVQFALGQWQFFSAALLFPAEASNYVVSGLPNGTGLAINAKNGTFSGAATVEDVNAADSLPSHSNPITISAKDKAGAVVSQSLLLGFWDAADSDNHAPFARIIPQSQAFPGHAFLMDVWASFADPDGDDLLFSVVGLPANSGFQIAPDQGVFFGLPSEADITAPQPLVLTIIADDQRGGRAQENLLLTVSESNSPLKSCRQLGWSVSAGSSVCARAPKVLDGCTPAITFNDAQKFCSALGARLCSSQELSDPRFSDDSGDECDVKNARVWTSSWCADGEVITQASTSDNLGAVAKECSEQESRAGMLKCCANSEVEAQSFAQAAAISEKTCEQLPTFGTSPSSPNKAVCSTSLVLTKKGQGKDLCSGDVTLDVAKDLCAKRGARLCTADELSQDVGNDQDCGYHTQRVWTSSECPFEGQVLTQAGASVFLRTIPKQCTKTNATLPVYCCADQKPGEYFQNLNVNATAREIGLSWTWLVYPHAELSLRKASSRKGTAVWSVLKQVRMGGDASVTLSTLDAATRYEIRITPVTAAAKPVKAQSLQFTVSTI